MSMPSKDAAAKVEGNPISKDSKEESRAQSKANDTSSSGVETRGPQDSQMDYENATAAPSGRGVRGTGDDRATGEVSDENSHKSHVEESQQMGAPGEGKVASAVKNNKGMEG